MDLSRQWITTAPARLHQELLPALFLLDVSRFRVHHAQGDPQLSRVVRGHDEHLHTQQRIHQDSSSGMQSHGTYLAVRDRRVEEVESNQGIRDDKEEAAHAGAEFGPSPQILRITDR